MTRPNTQFKRSQSAEMVIMLKRKVHNIRYLLFRRHFIDTRHMKKVAQMNISELNEQYKVVADMYLKAEKSSIVKKLINKAKVWWWMCRNNITKFDEELYQ